MKEFLHPLFTFQSPPVLHSHCNSTSLWISLLHLTTTTWISNRHSIQNAAVISPTKPAPSQPLPCHLPIHLLKLETRNHSLTFRSSSAPHLMHHWVPTTLPLKCISNASTSAQLLWYHLKIGPSSLLNSLLVWFLSSILATCNPPGNPGILLRYMALSPSPARFAPCLPWLSPPGVFASHPAHSTRPLHMAGSFSSFRSPLKCHFLREFFPESSKNSKTDFPLFFYFLSFWKIVVIYLFVCLFNVSSAKHKL